MAINDLIGKVFSSQYIAGVKQVTPLLSVCNDRSAEVRAKGDGLEIPLTQGMVTAVSDYPSASDAITYGSLTPSKTTLALDKEKVVAFKIEDTDEAQLAFNAFQRAQDKQDKNLQGN